MTAEPISLQSYVLGFVFSLILTLSAYFIATEYWLAGPHLLFTLGGLAALQAVVQLLFFFHLAEEESPRWKFYVFLFMLLIAAIIIFGSIWIMYNLDYRMMPKM